MVDIYSIITNVGSTFIVGLLTGFIFKKLINVIGLITGIQIAFITYLDYVDIININWNLLNKITNTIQSLILEFKIPEQTQTTEFYLFSSHLTALIIGILIGYYKL